MASGMNFKIKTEGFFSFFNSLDMNKLRQKLLFASLFFLFLFLSLTSLVFPLRQTLTIDEPYHYENGEAVLSGKAYELGASDAEHRNIMPASVLNVMFGETVFGIAEKVGITDKIVRATEISRSREYSSINIKNIKIYTGKLATILASITLAVYVFRWSNRLYGLSAGILALSIYVLDPNIIAHSQLVHQDLFSACTVFIAIYYFWSFLKFGGRKNALLSIVAFGIAQIARYSSIYLIPIYLLLAFSFYSKSIYNVIRFKKYSAILFGLKRALVYFISLLITTILIINISFSFEKTFTKFGDYQFLSGSFISLQSNFNRLNSLPVPVPYAYLSGLDFGKYKQETGFGGGVPYLMGKLGLENGRLKPFLEYYLITLLYKLPIATQLLILTAFASLIRFRRSLENLFQDEAFLVIPPLFFIIAFGFTTAQVGIRYILPALPFLFVLASRSLILFQQNNKVRYAFVASLLIYLSISNLSYFPHYMSYFNEFLLDRRFAYTILADSNLDLGQNKVYLSHYLENHPNVKMFDNFDIFDRPQAGLVVIPVNILTGAFIPRDENAHLPTTERGEKYRKEFRWIRENLKPLDHIAYGYLLFEFKPKDIPYLR